MRQTLANSGAEHRHRSDMARIGNTEWVRFGVGSRQERKTLSLSSDAPFPPKSREGVKRRGAGGVIQCGDIIGAHTYSETTMDSTPPSCVLSVPTGFA